MSRFDRPSATKSQISRSRFESALMGSKIALRRPRSGEAFVAGTLHREQDPFARRWQTEEQRERGGAGPITSDQDVHGPGFKGSVNQHLYARLSIRVPTLDCSNTLDRICERASFEALRDSSGDLGATLLPRRTYLASQDEAPSCGNLALHAG